MTGKFWDENIGWNEVCRPRNSLSDREKVLYSIGLYGVMIWNMRHLLLSHLIAMYMTVSLVVIDTQEALAVRKRAFPALSRSLQCFCHRYSYEVDHQTEKR